MAGSGYKKLIVCHHLRKEYIAYTTSVTICQMHVSLKCVLSEICLQIIIIENQIKILEEIWQKFSLLDFWRLGHSLDVAQAERVKVKVPVTK